MRGLLIATGLETLLHLFLISPLSVHLSLLIFLNGPAAAVEEKAFNMGEDLAVPPGPGWATAFEMSS